MLHQPVPFICLSDHEPRPGNEPVRNFKREIPAKITPPVPCNANDHRLEREKIEKKNIDLEKTGKVQTNYTNLTGLIEKARRAKMPPMISKVSVTKSIDGPVLELEGRNLAVAKKYTPVAVVNDKLAEVLSHKSDRLLIKMNEDQLKNDKNELVVTLDPFAIFKMNINAKKSVT